MVKQVRYGMVGGSVRAFIGDVHRKAIGFDPRARLAAGCFSTKADINRETGDTLFVDPRRVYADYAEMAREEAAREDGIDFVSVVTPNNTHYSVCKAFLSAGIHVVCEKPLCFTAQQAWELLTIARERDLLFGVTYGYTGYAMAKVMREMIARGDIGTILSVNAEYPQDWLLNELDPSGGGNSNIAIWRTDPRVSGISNCVGDIGTHIENFVHYVTGLRIKRLLATANTFGKALDMNANILVQYENGANGAYWCSQVAAGHANDLTVRVYGDRGALQWSQIHPDELVYSPRNRETQRLVRGSGYLDTLSASVSRIPAGHPEGLYVAFANVYRNYISALIEKKNGGSVQCDFPTVEDGLYGVRFVQAVIKSAARDAAWVEV